MEEEDTSGESQSVQLELRVNQYDFPEEVNENVKKNELFDFESEYLALKGNSDYANLLQNLATLEAQRVKAIRDIETLNDLKSSALNDPIKFVEKLQNKERFPFPKPQKIAEIVEVDWQKYSHNIDSKSFKNCRPVTKSKVIGVKTSSPDDDENCVENDKDVNVILVRGRQYNENKSSTFNRLWTPEEQKKLEELLIKYPSEQMERKRWQKIANELGNRTTIQVASRVQKYFIKLAKAGLPIPGRVPSSSVNSRRGYFRGSKNQKFNFQPSSTFFASYEPPVYMDDDDDDANTSLTTVMPKDTARNGWSEVPKDMVQSEEYEELMQLENLKQDILQMEGVHTEYKCDHCLVEPIIGVRWHCIDCSLSKSVDYCDECFENVQDKQIHFVNHHFEKVISSSVKNVDTDYQHFSTDGYNYLDPNFMAAI